MQREYGEISLLNLTRRQNNYIFTKLQEIVEQHDALISVCGKMSRALTVIVVLHFISAAIVICDYCMMMFSTQIPEWFIYFLYACGVVTEAYIFGYAGSALIYSSNGMKDAAYNFEWYKRDERNRKTILFIMQRAQRKVCIEVPFSRSSLEAFIAVRKRYLNVLTIQYPFPDNKRDYLIRNISEELHMKRTFNGQRFLELKHFNYFSLVTEAYTSWNS